MTEVLTSTIESLKNVGPMRAKELHALGINTLGDLLEYFPRNYRSESSERSIADLRSDEIQTARGEVVAVDYISGRSRPRFEVTLDDSTGKLSLAWFNGAWLRTKIFPGLVLRVVGAVKLFHGIPQMVNPKWEIIGADAPKDEESKFRAVYPASTNLPSETIGRIVEANLDTALESIEEWFGESLLKKHKLLGRKQAYEWIHRPANLDQAARARQRLVYDELMLLQLGLGISKRQRDGGKISAAVLRIDKLLDQRISKRFPFDMTTAQRNVVWEILHDLKSGHAMNRLLQGDVGSGKTAVAVYVMLTAVANKLQAALLAPTEVLAEQHYLTLSNLLKDSQVTIELFTNRTKRESKGSILKYLADGKIHIAIGTQALIQEDVSFANLGLVVVDEQHKLGVRQRERLHKMGRSPHYLVMTATPIPRTLALSYFADFDVSTINELPPGRQPIKTRWLKRKEANKAYDFIRKEIQAGRQAYIVLPQIDDDGLDESKSVTKEFKRLGEGPLHGLKLAMLHGQMTTAQKQQTMTDFRDGKIDVLVATTVIEVGIDVPNSTVMLIDNADHFGLSQLHQLRGRVGRGKDLSHCILIADPPNPDAEARLRAMTQTSNGFEIAEMDLQLRGPGTFFGTRQHGLPEFKLADISQELDLLQQAKDDALAILNDDPKLAKMPVLRKALLEEFGQRLNLAQIG